MTAWECQMVPPPQGEAGLKEKIIVQLGRYGDINNVLPLALELSKTTGGKVNWLVGEKFASIFDGVSYVNPIVWQGDPDSLPQAIAHYRGKYSLVVTQAWMNPDQRQQTKSFALEQWRYVGLLGQRGKWPLLFDQSVPAVIRSPKRDKPLVLCATTSVSTPYAHADRLIAMLRGLDADVIDLDEVEAGHIYDLISIFNDADCLVSVDTMHLHLARASYCPVVALINDGWKGAVPPPQTIASWRYAEIGNNLGRVVDAVEKRLARRAESLALVIHTFQPTEERHERAIATHPKDAIYARFDHRPKIAELLQRGLDTGRDVVAFTNDDTAIGENGLNKILSHTKKWEFGCSRRPREPVHIGREIFWFRSDWLKAHWNEIPDCYWTVPRPDLILAKWMRRIFGIPTTMENLDYDFAPVELPAGIITHEDHPSAWATPEVEQSMETNHNKRVWEAMA